MKHRVAGRKLGRTSSHRLALLRNLPTQLFAHERITTTLMKAKEMRPFAERLLTLAKRETLHARRQVLRHIHDREVVAKLFDTISARFAQRPGGYTRILKLGPQLGDNAEMAIVELVDALLVEIGLKGIGQLDLSPRVCQRPWNPAVDRKKARQFDESAGCMLETAKLRELLQGVWGKHIFPDHIPAGGEAKKVDQSEGIPDEGPMKAIGLYGSFPLKVVNNRLHQHADVFIGHRVSPEVLLRCGAGP